MSKSRKKKSRKSQVSGQTLGYLALIISIVALGLSAYQFIATPSGPQFYSLEHSPIIWLDRYSTVEYLYELNITYYAQVGDVVVLEFSCRVHMDSDGTTTDLELNFVNNGTYIVSSSIQVSGTSDINTAGHMTHSFEAATAGEYNVLISAYCIEEVDNFVSNCYLTVTVY